MKTPYNSAKSTVYSFSGPKYFFGHLYEKWLTRVYIHYLYCGNTDIFNDTIPVNINNDVRKIGKNRVVV